MSQFHLKQEAARCLLCEKAPCTAASSHGDPARAVRAIRFDNPTLGARLFAACSEEDLEAAEKACIHYDRPVRLRDIAKALPEPAPVADPPSLEIDFCGLHCENPFFLASSAVCTNYEMVARTLDAGWGGVFYKTICLQEIKEVSPRFDAVELNFSYPQMRLSGMGSDVGQNTELVALYTTYVKQAVKIPVIPKMTPNVASLTQFALSAHFAGADGISAINTIKSVTMGAEVNGKRIISGYSGSAVKPIALRFMPGRRAPGHHLRRGPSTPYRRDEVCRLPFVLSHLSHRCHRPFQARAQTGNLTSKYIWNNHFPCC